MANVLIIDDDHMVREMLCDMVQEQGHRCVMAGSLAQGLAEAEARPYDVVFQDVYLPDGTGLDILPRLLDSPGRPEVIVITGAGDAQVAERAMREGAWDFVAKPLDLAAVSAPLARAVRYREDKRARRDDRTILRKGIAGSSALMRALMHTVALAGESGASVLITGETGTGKELFARAIHANSPRAAQPFVVVDCASLPETLVESILFGHVKGAFTGADKAREGLVALAHGGTLFLDEVGELPFSMQRAFLRVLEDRTFRPVGSKTEQSSDFRLVAATNRQLEAMVERGEFRKDLLFRIRSFSIELPPLRERSEDIPEIVALQMEKLAAGGRFGRKDFSPEFMEALTAYPWPGNVRELVQCLERSLAAAGPESVLYLKHLPDEVRVSYARTLVNRDGPSLPLAPAPPSGQGQGGTPPGPAPSAPAPPQADADGPWADYREAVVGVAEREYFSRLLRRTGGDVRRCCAEAGVSRARLYQILQKHGLSRR